MYLCLMEEALFGSGAALKADQNRIARHQPPLYGVVGRFERINEHPGAGPRTFSFGISEAINTNLVIELAADDIEYVYQRIPGKILGVTVPTFEALAQYGTADIKTKNTGKVEASYSLTFKCSKGVTMMEEQFFIMKPEEVGNRSFKIYLTSDQASKYACSAILKDSEFNEVDRAECQFTTTATVLDNGTQGAPFQPPKSETAKLIWNYQRPMEQVLGWFIRLHHRKELQKQVFWVLRLPLSHSICVHELGHHVWIIFVHLSHSACASMAFTSKRIV
ncbi:protein HAPLESS 2-like [Chenopodium quinoa]|uniref:protein HAPLESS 2-like n=1 Tax=Chenopodium quinoa TaxID=63459 RepID=UPI000B77E9C7|nr:protein HAPLESS 2-like [Chenopodium quinoa]